ncbi:sodium- and chloride-dependent glycine transporter 1-like [Physella acuta]|uniref:sodium- and chloride-dependent glycine transporter 1-like n=1 Tax=Physella acuta TaxID=109671 RepID=UPI0027DDAAD3|nr:sodium- and chloride-dependent glycine transporter 1-like [Physella acuta]
MNRILKCGCRALNCCTKQKTPADEQHDQSKGLTGGDDPEADLKPPEEAERHTWSRKAEYLLSLIGYCVGLGNVWRFPYVCIRNGGGAFLLPFLICLAVIGLPLYFLEVAMGQFMSKGAYHVWNICPLFKGIGIGQIIVGFISSWYYIILIAWILIYLVNSFKSPLPWTLCGQEWNSDRCVPQGSRVLLYNTSTVFYNISSNNNISSTSYNISSTSYINGTLGSSQNQSSHEIDGHYITFNGSLDTSNLRPASEEFWIKNVLELSSGLETMGGLPWHTTVALLVACTCVFLCLIKGIKSVGKVVYVTATLPYILITVLIIKGATLPGAVDGVLFYIWPDFSKLLLRQTWLEASLQVVYSLGPIWGGLVTVASYNKFNNNCLRDSIMLTFLCEGTSIFAGFAIFTVLGHMAYNLNVPVDKFADTGAGLAFVVYPEAIAYLPVPQLWGVLFFLMLFTVALDSQFVFVEIVLTCLHDLWPKFVTKRSLLVKIGYSSFQFLIGLPFASRGGIYLFQLVDWYIAAFAALSVGILECVIVGWIYGAEKMLSDVYFMTGRRPPYVFVLLWRFIVPALYTLLLIVTLMTYEAPVFEGYTYGPGGVAFGWFVATVWFLPVPVVAVLKLVWAKGSISQRFRSTCTPSEEWRPGDVTRRGEYKAFKQNSNSSHFKFPCLS